MEKKFRLKWPRVNKLERLSTLSLEDKIQLAFKREEMEEATCREVLEAVLGDREVPAYYKKNPSRVFKNILKYFEKVAAKGSGPEFDRLVEVGIIEL